MFCSFKGEGTGAVRHMFNNHVLKPEKTPLENSVWGTLRNSGSFCALFKSRLLKAQEYREHPFEVKALDGSKVYCSAPMQAKSADDFKQLEVLDEPSYLVLNGDSSALPLPDNSVDAVITDPPYFDFVHYSELSDFFYAWLKPILEKSNPNFTNENSRREGEVQQREPIVFAQALGNVLLECKRVMKDDAVLAFSFHHSRLDGWLAIYHAIEKAGLSITSVYPVKAEMSTASPKSSNKEPINIDAIFVCKKAFTTSAILVNDNMLWADSQSAYRSLCKRLIAVGRELSEGDKRVIMVSSFLSQCSTAGLSYEQVSEKLAGKELKDLSEYLPELKEVLESTESEKSLSMHSSECEVCISKIKVANSQLLMPVCS
ncbi:MAG: hypothetical protein EOO85_24290 [Pedobacter sp.]|nr:MAG: hypothetical protein EOO85_24290 [Pedobacter sp.]